MTTTENRIPALSRAPRTPVAHPVAFYDSRQGSLTLQDGRCIILGGKAPLATVLARLINDDLYKGLGHTVTLYVVAGTEAEDSRRRGLVHEWYKAPAGYGWQVEYQPDSNAARRTARYAKLATDPGRPLHVELRHTASWFGDYTASVVEMRGALDHLLSMLRELSPWNGVRGNGLAVLLGTPAQTAQHLLLCALPFGRDYPVLPEDLRRLIYANLPQARREVYTQEAGDLPGFVEYDARVAYLGCMRRPATFLREHRERTHLHNAEISIEPFVPAFYAGSWQVPRDWDRRQGILPEKMGDEAWAWPATPGSWHYSWFSGHEASLALAHGWKIHTHEALIFAPGTTPGGDPLYTFQDNIATLYLRCSEGRYDQLREKLLRGTLRALAIGLVGTFHRRGNEATLLYPTETPWDVLTAQGNEMPRRIPSGWEVKQRRQLSAYGLRFAHPEWSASIWGLMRYRVGVRMLGLPRLGVNGGKQGPERHPGIADVDLIGCNTDMVATTCLQPQIVDQGRIGDWRVKGALPGPLPAPLDLSDLAQLSALGEAELERLGV